MNLWTEKFPLNRRLIGYLRLMRANCKYFPHYVRARGLFGPLTIAGYNLTLADWRNKYAGRRCFVIANGPSLNKLDMSLLKDEITIGCNGIYKKFSEWGFHTKYLVTEDMYQTEMRAREFEKVQGPVKLAGLHNAYAFSMKSDIVYFNTGTRLSDYYWTDLYPRFSEDFASIVYLGGTVAYIMLQLAYFLGCNPVYVVGLDFNYGELPKLFPPGWMRITEENYHLVRGLHVDPDYYKIGDEIGVPYVTKMRQALEKAGDAFKIKGLELLNAGVDSQLDAYPFVDFNELFK